MILMLRGFGDDSTDKTGQGRNDRHLPSSHLTCDVQIPSFSGPYFRPVSSSPIQTSSFANCLEQTIVIQYAMPSGSATSKPIEPPPSLQPKDRSISQVVKGGGFNDLTHMMNCYGLKRHDEADVQEAKAIIMLLVQTQSRNIPNKR